MEQHGYELHPASHPDDHDDAGNSANSLASNDSIESWEENFVLK